jgi:hypothetical protein
MIGLVGTCTFSTVAPRTELYIRLACADLRPEYDAFPIFLPWPQLPHRGGGDNSTYASDMYTHPASFAGGYPTPHHGHPRPIFDLNYYPTSTPGLGDGDTKGLPGPNERCNTDPVVQAAVARLSAGASLVLSADMSIKLTYCRR